MSQGSVRERLLEAAARRFYEDGVHATGIDTITSGAGVAKKSLYNNFSSKEELVCAYINARHEEWLGFQRERSAKASTAADRVVAVFDAYIDHANDARASAFEDVGCSTPPPSFRPDTQPARPYAHTRSRWRRFSPRTWNP